jgi:(p)ppGpp synthase/HD superfamily hydrolase
MQATQSIRAPAQTCVQLYRQLLDREADAAVLVRVRDACALAANLHSARFRPSGRPFLCHVVGTASILADVGAHTDVILAGLLHGVYDQGDFGDGTRGMTEWKRTIAREAAGALVEQRVAAFCRLEWARGDWQRKRALADGLDAVGRDALLIRLANELEELLDFEIQFRRDARERLAELGTALDVSSALARAIGHPELGDALIEAGQRCAAEPLPEPVVDSVGANYDRWPRSLSRRPGVAIRALLMRGRDVARRAMLKIDRLAARR